MPCIPTVTCSRRFESNYYTWHTSVNSPRNANNLTAVKLSKAGPTHPGIIPSCMVINAHSLVKPDAMAVLNTELRINKVDLCFVSETWLNSKVASS